MALHIPDICVIRLFMRFAIPSADFITNSRIWENDTFLASPKEFVLQDQNLIGCNRLEVSTMDESMNQEVPLHIAGEITIVRKPCSLICKSEYTSVTAG